MILLNVVRVLSVKSLIIHTDFVLLFRVIIIVQELIREINRIQFLFPLPKSSIWGSGIPPTLYGDTTPRTAAAHQTVKHLHFVHSRILIS